ncbi:MAG: MEDS domain-containing protein [Gemmatimonadales bacterium]
MSHGLVSALLIDAPVNRHFAQLHRDAQELADAVALFAEAGLRRGNGVVILATPAHRELLLQRLRDSGPDPASLRAAGQLEILDAQRTLDAFLRASGPDWATFHQQLAAVLERVRARSRGTTRVYAELVNLLWQRGQPEAAIQLEEFWNHLGRLYPCSLFCSYMLDPQTPDCYAGPIEEIARTHSDVIATAEDERFRVALDAASRDVFGVPLSQMVGVSPHVSEGEERFPVGQRTMLWVRRNLPSASTAVLERARRYYAEAVE